MFHVCQLLPHSRTDKHQVARKRHLGNDPVILIFKERTPSSSSSPQPQPDLVDITSIRSQWNHVFIIVSPEGSGTYRVNAVYKAGVEPAAPYVPETSLLVDDDSLHDWLLRKSLFPFSPSSMFLPPCTDDDVCVVQSSTLSAVLWSRRCSGRVPSVLLSGISRPSLPSAVHSSRARRPLRLPSCRLRPRLRLLVVCSIATHGARSTATAISLPTCPEEQHSTSHSLSPPRAISRLSTTDCFWMFCVCVGVKEG